MSNKVTIGWLKDGQGNKFAPKTLTSQVQTSDGEVLDEILNQLSSEILPSDRLPIVPVDKGGTGATTAAGALTNLGLTATAAEINYVDGVTSNIQTQLDGKAPSSHTHDDRYYTETEVDTAIADAKNTWYGTCTDTSQTNSTRVVTTTTQNFTLTAGNILYVLFSGPPYMPLSLNVDGTGAVAIKTVNDTNVVGTQWTSNEVVGFVYDGTCFRMLDGMIANTSYYGMTKLSSSTNSTSTSLAATPSAVKSAYDLANTANTAAANLQSDVDSLSEAIADKVGKTGITLDKDTDGLIYIFVDGKPVGNGVEFGEIVAGDVIGTLDEDNNILLSGNIAVGTYPLKWKVVDENGEVSYVDAGTLNVGEIPEPEPIKTNFAGTLSAGRLSNSAGGNIASDAKSSKVTDFISVSTGDVLVVQGISTAVSPYLTFMTFDLSKNKLSSVADVTKGDTSYCTVQETTSTGATVTVINDSVEYIRFSGNPSGSEEDIVVNIKRNGEWL